MASLLRAAAKQGIAPGYVRRLLAAVNQTDDRTPVHQQLIEPLSERELDVLRLLGATWTARTSPASSSCP